MNRRNARKGVLGRKPKTERKVKMQTKERYIPKTHTKLFENHKPDMVVYGDEKTAIAFFGKRTHHEWYYTFKTVEKRDNYIKEWAERTIKNFAEHEKIKAERKNTPSSHALTASVIRKELNHYFPTVKFQVRSDSFANGNSVDIDWTDGPTTDQVNKIVRKYEYGHFDGMTDCYEMSNHRDDIPQVKFVMSHRSMSEKTGQEITERIKKTYAGLEDFDPEKWYEEPQWRANGHTLIYREFVNLEVWN